jgi:acetyl-CoA carboxylase carboxyltransferase component
MEARTGVNDVQQSYKAATRGFVDDVIEASTTQPMLIRSLGLFKTKHEAAANKHGNIHQPIRRRREPVAGTRASEVRNTAR